MQLNGDDLVQITADDVLNQYWATWSPDGEWITFLHGRFTSGSCDPVFVIPAHERNARVSLKRGPAFRPVDEAGDGFCAAGWVYWR